VSVQALERSLPGFDLVLAADLGRALASALDVALVTGTNANGQPLGLVNVTGIKTVAYTDASATAQEFLSKTWAAYDQIATSGWGTATLGLYATVIHTRRLAFLFANAQNAQTLRPQVPGNLVPCAALRSTLGASTNEDEAFVLVPSELPVYAEPPVFVINVESLSGTLTVRIVARQAIATGFGRAPGAICRISGTGMSAPSL
jgi:hypothetical protein